MRGLLRPSVDRATTNRWRGRGWLRYFPLAGLHQDRHKQVQFFKSCKEEKIEEDKHPPPSTLASSALPWSKVGRASYSTNLVGRESSAPAVHPLANKGNHLQVTEPPAGQVTGLFWPTISWIYKYMLNWKHYGPSKGNREFQFFLKVNAYILLNFDQN